MRTKQDYEYGITELKLNHSFSLKMAAMICWSVVASIISLGLFFGDKSLLVLGFTVILALVLGIVTFGVTRSACL